MSVARTTEITATSNQGFEQAIRDGLDRASETIRNIKSSWIKDQEVVMDDGKIDHFKVTMKVTFVLDA